MGNGLQRIEYLEHRGAFTNASEYPRPDVILMDLDMPEMGGEEALLRIRGNAALRDIPIAVLTSRNVDHELALALEGAALFHEPFELPRRAPLARRYTPPS